MAEFIYNNKIKNGAFINFDQITAVYLRKEVSDEEGDKLYEEETGLSAPVYYEICIDLGKETYVYERLTLETFDKAARIMEIGIEDVANLYVASLLFFKFSITLEQFLWLILNDKNESEVAVINKSGIMYFLQTKYEEIHNFREDTALFKDISGYMLKGKANTNTAQLNPKQTLEEKRDKYGKWE